MRKKNGGIKMSDNKLHDLYFSQSALDIFQKCRKRFQYRYIDGLYWPAKWGIDAEIEKELEKGRKFHLLAERYYLDGSIQDQIVEDPELNAWLKRLKSFLPYSQYVISSEQELRYRHKKFKFLAKYDLLYYNKEKKLIELYDWKTDKKSLLEKELENSTQSRFYLYLFKKAGQKYYSDKFDIQNNPDLIFWNPRFPEEKKIINYSDEDFSKDSIYFEDLVGKILMEDEFPMTNNFNICRYCEYRPICRGKQTEKREIFEEDLDMDLNWEEIEELEF